MRYKQTGANASTQHWSSAARASCLLRTTHGMSLPSGASITKKSMNTMFKLCACAKQEAMSSVIMAHSNCTEATENWGFDEAALFEAFSQDSFPFSPHLHYFPHLRPVHPLNLKLRA
ncbi:hypothetical protein DUNSADRAFT_6592 [Dunaliella salina]|uniref:Encoded protein n=1 Tax=Dunaliella salina TaxID=3046 RepID=A0ABQ7GMY6_DUNSA|nr:hypothetical protein DUNSADRAFT_6592 [Dunaliella salina]|eukprot:KAF5835976.1 hypothetical protein DUNSADRAFT_6592 [Dunaliella salina]